VTLLAASLLDAIAGNLLAGTLKNGVLAMLTLRYRLFAAIVLACIQPLQVSAQGEDIRERIAANHLEFVPTGQGPFTTLIAIPGCSGIAFSDPEEEAGNPLLSEDDRLFRQHYLRTARSFRDAGFAVILVHVHGAEGLVTACNGEISGERIAQYIDESIAWVSALDLVRSGDIHVIGWSMGGGGALAWLGGVRSQKTQVRTVITVYPSCSRKEPISNGPPLLMLLGGADDIAKPDVCLSLIAKSDPSLDAEVITYPGARHGFDISDAASVLELKNGLTIGYQRAAATESWRAILAFISKYQNPGG
jgi:dienelactone hydrolase